VEVLREIGWHQSAGRPLTLKTLFLQGVGSAATVQRRLSRLKRLGAIQQVRSDEDKRVLELTVNPDVWKLYQRLGKLMRKALA
jgi:DNA-binding MarR family transcriptional regulator